MIERKFTALLVSLVLLLLLYPAFQWAPEAILLHNLAFTLVVIATIYAIEHSRRSLMGASLLMVVALTGTWSARFTTADWPVWIGMFAAALLFMYTAWVILREVLRSERITLDTLAGGIVVYLFIGVIWAFAYVLVALLDPQALHYAAGSARSGVGGFDDFHTFLYFSFTTLTTLGYGDVVPVNPLARSLAYLEAVFGQLYLAVLIARLVGQHLSTSNGRA